VPHPFASCQHGRVLIYSLFDFDPERDGEEEAWARAVAAEGWRTWHPTGVWVTVGSRRVRRVSLRRRRQPAAEHSERGNGRAPESCAAASPGALGRPPARG